MIKITPYKQIYRKPSTSYKRADANKAVRIDNPIQIYKDNQSIYTQHYLSFKGKHLSQDGLNDLYNMTKDEKKSKDFIDSYLADKRNRNIAQELIKQAGGEKPFKQWYFADNGYKNAYSKYIRKQVENAKNPDNLLAISPNWFPWVLENKFGENYTFGTLPDEFKNQTEYEKLVHSLLSGNIPENVRELKGGESGKRAFLIEQKDKKYVLKVQNDYLIYSKALKNAVEEDSWLKDSFIKNYKENEMMKSDSVFLNAMIDRYLNLNDCQNSIKMHYYDSKTSSVLYEFADGEKYDGDLNILNANEVLSDLNNLGMIYNDISTDNLKKIGGKTVIIDSGESNFADILRPTVAGLQFQLPNWSGNDIVSLNAALHN